MLIFRDASECHWGSFVTQVPDAEMDQNLPVEDMTHEPLAFLSGTFEGSQMRWGMGRLAVALGECSSFACACGDCCWSV